MREPQTPDPGDEPRFGQRLPAPERTPPRPKGPREWSGRELRAWRRMARGLSFTALALGFLIGLGGVAIGGAGQTALLVIAGVLAVTGVVGYILIETGRLPRRAQREPNDSRVRRIARTVSGRIGIGLAIVATALLALAGLVHQIVEGTPAESDELSFILGAVMYSLSLFIAAAIMLTIAVINDEPSDVDPGPGSGPGRDKRREPPPWDSTWITGKRN